MSLCLTIFVLLLQSMVLTHAQDYKPVSKDIQDHWEGNGYSVKIYFDFAKGGAVQIFKDNKQVYLQKGFQFKLGLQSDDMPESKLVKPGKDITGDGVPDLVVSEWSGGAHCCFVYNVFSLGKEFKFIDQIENSHGYYGKFKDVDGDGVLEFLGHDFTFSYWHESFAGSPAPEIILDFKDGAYRLALGKMKKPINPLVYKSQLDEFRNASRDQASLRLNKVGWERRGFVLPSMVWSYMLDLIYTGHPKEAWGFLHDVWPKGKAGKERFIKEFKEQQSRSYYWDNLKSLIEQKDSTELTPTQTLSLSQRIRLLNLRMD